MTSHVRSLVLQSSTLRAMTSTAPNGADQVEVASAAHAGHVGTGCLAQLHGEVPDTAGCADDDHAIAFADVGLVADHLQCGERRDTDGGRLLERQVLWSGTDVVAWQRDVRGEFTPVVAPTEDLIAGFEVVHAVADGFDDAAMSTPWIVRFGRNSPSLSRTMAGSARSRCQSSACNEVARMVTSTSSSPMVGIGSSCKCIVLGPP